MLNATLYSAHKDSLWTVKYAPTQMKELCGNTGQIEKLKKWLEAWFADVHCIASHEADLTTTGLST